MDDTHQITEEAIELARKWQNRANELQTRRQRAHQRKFARLFDSSTDKIILTKLIDQGFRSADNRRRTVFARSDGTGHHRKNATGQRPFDYPG